MRALKRTGDEGATLLLVLIFIAVFAMILGALLPAIAAGLTNSKVVRDFDARLYTANSALDYEIQQVRWDSSLCPDVPSGQSPPLTVPQTDPRLAATNVTVTCKTTSGSSDALGGYAAIITDTSGPNNLETKEGNGKTKLIDGPVWATGISSKDAEIKGNLTQLAGQDACSGQAAGAVLPSGTYGAGWKVDPPYVVKCVAASTSAPVPSMTFPDNTHLTAKSEPVLKLGNCSVFAPGIYNAPLDLSANNYLASGVYWLNNVTLDSGGGNIVGGAVSPGDSYENPQVKACSNDAAASDANNGQGVVIVLDGNSSINASDNSVELFARSGGQAWEGTQGFSVETTSAWRGNSAITIDNGSKPNLVVHGGVFAPNAPVDLDATSATAAELLGGVVAHTLEMYHAANNLGELISVHTGVGFRRMLLTATVQGSNGGRDVVATAVVDIGNDSSSSLTVESRRNGGLSQTS